MLKLIVFGIETTFAEKSHQALSFFEPDIFR